VEQTAIISGLEQSTFLGLMQGKFILSGSIDHIFSHHDQAEILFQPRSASYHTGRDRHAGACSSPEPVPRPLIPAIYHRRPKICGYCNNGKLWQVLKSTISIRSLTHPTIIAGNAFSRRKIDGLLSGLCSLYNHC